MLQSSKLSWQSKYKIIKTSFLSYIPDSYKNLLPLRTVCNYEISKGDDNCPAVTVPKCPPGHVVQQENVEECIPSYNCTCDMDVSPCPEEPTCGDLEELVITETDCCPVYECGKLSVLISDVYLLDVSFLLRSHAAEFYE